MNERRMRDGIAVIAAIIIMALMGLTLLVSCTTKEIVTKETSYVHDTVEVYRADTLWEYKFITQKDTVKQESVHTVVLNDRGDTIKEIHHYHDSEKVIVVDSTNRYKATVDSLQKALHEQQTSKTEVKQSKRWRGYVLTVIITAAFVIAIIGLVNTKIKK